MDIFTRNQTNNKTVIIDSFLDQDSLEYFQKTIIFKINNSVDKNIDEKFIYFNEDHQHKDICMKILNETQKYYDLSSCLGYELWSQSNTRPKNWHYDKDENLRDTRGIFKFPICSTVYYLVVNNVSGGRLLLDDDIITPKENRLVIFPPAIYHYVEKYEGERTSILINPWTSKLLD